MESKNKNKERIDLYYEELLKVWQAAKGIQIFNCSLSDSFLWSIIKSSWNAGFLEFYSCQFDISSSLPLDGPSYKIESLCLHYSGNKHSNGQFYFDKESFEYIIAAVSESTMKYSLKIIYLVYSELSSIEVRQTLNKYGLKHVKMM